MLDNPNLVGLVVVGILGFTAPRLGLVPVLTLFVASQFIVGAGLDHFGLLGAEVRALDLSRASGVGVILFGVAEGSYFRGMYDTVTWSDLAMGFTKSIAFGGLITWICCAKGFLLHLERRGAFGAEGVSRVTTDAVVLSSIALLFTDYLISAYLV